MTREVIAKPSSFCAAGTAPPLVLASFRGGGVSPAPEFKGFAITSRNENAVPCRSRLWFAADTNDSRFVTWENFALNRDTNTPVNAQVGLYPMICITLR